MGQLTLTGFYGPKPPALAGLLRDLSGLIESTYLKEFFFPYPIEQIHGTLIGLERVEGKEKYLNANYWMWAGEKRSMDFSCLVSTLSEFLPMPLRIGGFAENFTGFRSFGDIPYRRALGIDWASGRVTLIGWPYSGGFSSVDFTGRRPLWELRNRLAQQCYVRHKYHRHEDNDFYMVLGTLHQPEGLNKTLQEKLKREGQQLENSARTFLYHNPIILSLDQDTVSIVRYERETLERHSSRAWKIRELLDGGIAIQQLYH